MREGERERGEDRGESQAQLSRWPRRWEEDAQQSSRPRRSLSQGRKLHIRLIFRIPAFQRNPAIP